MAACWACSRGSAVWIYLPHRPAWSDPGGPTRGVYPDAGGTRGEDKGIRPQAADRRSLNDRHGDWRRGEEGLCFRLARRCLQGSGRKRHGAGRRRVAQRRPATDGSCDSRAATPPPEGYAWRNVSQSMPRSRTAARTVRVSGPCLLSRGAPSRRHRSDRATCGGSRRCAWGARHTRGSEAYVRPRDRSPSSV